MLLELFAVQLTRRDVEIAFAAVELAMAAGALQQATAEA